MLALGNVSSGRSVFWEQVTGRADVRRSPQYLVAQSTDLCFREARGFQLPNSKASLGAGLIGRSRPNDGLGVGPVRIT